MFCELEFAKISSSEQSCASKSISFTARPILVSEGRESMASSYLDILAELGSAGTLHFGTKVDSVEFTENLFSEKYFLIDCGADLNQFLISLLSSNEFRTSEILITAYKLTVTV